MTTKAFLSVDWDYFVRSLGAWDWSHKEAPFFMSGDIWSIRLAPFLQQGFDLMKEMSPDKWARPKPSTFWSVLKQLGYNFDQLESFVVAESHSAAGPSFLDTIDILTARMMWQSQGANKWERPDCIINFDAHHDLGYCEWARLHELIEEGTCTCDMWLCALMEWLPEVEARIVYPNWLREESSLERQWNSLEDKFPGQMLSRVEMGFFEDEDGSIGEVVVPGEDIEVLSLFICRSGAWTPPWLDEQFVEFVNEAARETGVEPEVFESSQETGFNPLEPREFSIESAQLLAEQWKDIMKPKP
jgi:hypothetical protein